MNPSVLIETIAHGGDGVARPDGKATFVAGAVPGDLVELKVVDTRPRFDRAVVARLVEPSPVRVEPPCPVFGSCGGCTWQMAGIDAQREWKRQLVGSQLSHLGRVETDVRPVLPAGDPYRYRNRIDLRTDRGRWALLEEGSHRRVAIDDCLLVVDPLRVLMASTSAPAKQKVTLRAGVRTGESIAIGHGPGLVAPREAVINELVAGATFRISGRAFFQVNSEGADVLVSLVRAALEGGGSGRLLDGYAGGGLFAATVGSAFDEVVAVEDNPIAAADLAHNAPGARSITTSMEEALAGASPAFDAVVVDPPRDGLGADVVAQLTRLGAPVIASVSCDPASAARDARLLTEAGYRLEWVQPVDLFPQTPHIETVSRFTR